jgi:hypothetical protein
MRELNAARRVRKNKTIRSRPENLLDGKKR